MDYPSIAILVREAYKYKSPVYAQESTVVLPENMEALKDFMNEHYGDWGKFKSPIWIQLKPGTPVPDPQSILVIRRETDEERWLRVGKNSISNYFWVVVVS